MTKSLPDAALLNAIMKAAVDAIIVSDKHGVILRANPAVARIFGYGLNELIGQNVKVLMPHAMARMHDGFLKHHLVTGEKRIIGKGRDVDGLRKDGTVFPLHLSVGESLVEGRPLFIAILHDLTSRRAVENAAARSQRLEAIGQMTGGISHDFNNLLTVIIGNLELLEMRKPNAAQSVLIGHALEAAEMGANLTSQLLIFARKSALTPERVDLRETCQATLAILHRTLGTHFKIRTEFAAQISPTRVDPVLLQSALVNLALNARDAMPDGGEFLVTIENITIDDTYMAQEVDVSIGHYVRISVSDNGKGMSADAQRHAFEPFFTTKPEGRGTGLGLAMVYGFVRQSGGHITLYSEPGLGTHFGLYFPADDEADTLFDQGSVKTNTVPFGKGETVLVVEDNPKVRRLSGQRVRDLGFQVVEAQTGDEAFAILQTTPRIALVFSDLVMPGTLNGYDLASKIRDAFPHVKILLTSGYASDAVTDSMPHTEHFTILHKPYRYAELAERIRSLLA